MDRIIEAFREFAVGADANDSLKSLCCDAFGVDEHGEPLKSVSTLYRELNKEDKGAKLGFISGVLLMKASKNISPLEIVVSILGYRLVKIDASPDGDCMHHECLQAHEAVAKFTEKASDKKAYYTKLSPLLKKAIKELEDVFKRARSRDEAKE